MTNYQFANMDEARAYRASLAARLERDEKHVHSLTLALDGLAPFGNTQYRIMPSGALTALCFALHAVISIQVSQFEASMDATRIELANFDIALRRMESGLVLPGMQVGRA